jgi:DNA repair protein SbcC/Rad50
MDIKAVKLRNFLSHKGTVCAFSDGLLGIIGPNGSGKSSFIKDSITWCLWGKSRSNGAGDDLIHEDEDSCEVKIHFVVNSIGYGVRRERHRDKKTELKFAVWSGDTAEMIEKDLTRATVKDTQEEINKVLGMTYEVFKNSCCIEQGEAGSFSNLTPKEAADVLLRILQLDKYWNYKIAATDKFMQYKSESGKLVLTKNNLDEKINDIKNIDLVRKEKITKLENLKHKSTILSDKYKKSEIQYNNVAKKIADGESLQLTGNAELSVLNKQLVALEKRILLLSQINGHCPLCETQVSSDKKSTIQEKYSKEYEDLKEKITVLNTNLGLDKDTIDVWKHTLTTFKLTEKTVELTKLETEINTLEGELNILGFESPIASVTQELIVVTNRLEELKQKEDVYSELNLAFSSKGIPLLIIDNVLKELEVLINNNLQLLTDLPISVEIKTQKESTHGELLDTFQININNGLVSRPYFNYSGGEKMLIDLSIRLGLSELLARRNNFKVETLIIDEGLGSLDELNQVNFFKALMNLQTKFKKILVITHTEVKEYFPKVIEFKKEEKVSKLLV